MALSERLSSVSPLSATLLSLLFMPIGFALQCFVWKFETIQHNAVNSSDVQAWFFCFSLLLLNDPNILSTFDKVAEVYRLSFWSVCCEGLLALSNDTANLQLLGAGTCCSNVGSHCSSQVEVLLYGCIFSICFCSKY